MGPAHWFVPGIFVQKTKRTAKTGKRLTAEDAKGRGMKQQRARFLFWKIF
jgi:hypothetical protein